MELRVAAKRIARRMQRIRLAVPMEDIRYTPSVAALSMEALPLKFEGRSRPC
jgi:hypothetical protein